MSTMSGRVCENKDGSRQMLHKCLTTALCPTQDQNTPLIQRLNQRKCRLFIDTSPSVKYDMYFVCVFNLWQLSGFYLPFTNGHARADNLLGDSNQAIDKFGRRGWPNPKPLDSLPLISWLDRYGVLVVHNYTGDILSLVTLIAFVGSVAVSC